MIAGTPPPLDAFVPKTLLIARGKNLQNRPRPPRALHLGLIISRPAIEPHEERHPRPRQGHRRRDGPQVPLRLHLRLRRHGLRQWSMRQRLRESLRPDSAEGKAPSVIESAEAFEHCAAETGDVLLAVGPRRVHRWAILADRDGVELGLLCRHHRGVGEKARQRQSRDLNKMKRRPRREGQDLLASMGSEMPC